MKVLTEDVGGMKGVKLAYYSSPADLATSAERSKYNKSYQNRISGYSRNWAGGSFADFLTKSRQGDVSYARRAEKMVDRHANLAIKDYERVLDYNLISGQLDYQSAMGGDPMCMYGQTIEEVDTSPVHIYIDAWTSATVNSRAMERRGIAVLALTLALSMYRPVMTKLVTGLQHSPTKTNAVQIISVPTTPMDLSLASWMLASPTVFRRGLMGMIWELAGSSSFCGLPTLSNGNWQRRNMADWLAAREGVKDVVFLPMMFGGSEWDSDQYVQEWVQSQIKRFVE